MRIIRYRAHKIGTEEWVYGVPVESVNGRYYMIHGAAEGAVNTNNEVDFYFSEINHKTIGQFTGLLDKDGKQIFEGDILKGTSYLYGYQLEPNGHQFDFEGFVEWEEQCDVGLQWVLTDLEKKSSRWLRQTVHRNIPDFSTGKIIGNIHDNPKLFL